MQWKPTHADEYAMHQNLSTIKILFYEYNVQYVQLVRYYKQDKENNGVITSEHK